MTPIQGIKLFGGVTAIITVSIFGDSLLHMPWTMGFLGGMAICAWAIYRGEVEGVKEEKL